MVYLGAHSHRPEVSSIDYDRVTDYHYSFLGSFLGRYNEIYMHVHIQNPLLFLVFARDSVTNILFMLGLQTITVKRRRKRQFSTPTRDILMVLLQYLMMQKLLRYLVSNLD